jgi:D-methionine transport system permease protein
LAIVYGYQRFDTFAMVSTVIILIIFVQGIQSSGNVLARKARKE